MDISDEQVKLIANTIAFEVHQYIIEHQEQYKQFLAKELNPSQESTNSQSLKEDDINANDTETP